MAIEQFFYSSSQWALLKLRSLLDVFENNRKEEGNDQKSIQSSTTPDTGRHKGKWQKHKNSIYMRANRPAIFKQMTTRLQWTHKIAWQARNINNKNDPPKTVMNFLREGLVSWYQSHPYF